MKGFFYPKLAAGSIKRNSRLYLPYLLTSSLMSSMFYIIMSLNDAPVLKNGGGARTLSYILPFGGWVIFVFSAIFLFYTNSFLIRRRNREFGLYNVLGMGKKNIRQVVFWETLILAAASIVIGLAVGISLSKLFELILVKLIGETADYTFSVSPSSVLWTFVSFFAIYFVLFIKNVITVSRCKAVDLMKSENFGEKPPKGNIIIGLTGLLLLSCAYYIAATIEDPLDALNLFFIAVVMVIVATYLILISGSVLVCRTLQKNKKFYYKPNHFVSLSSMVFRMKRNGAGLASICILLTMVLVMISSSSCMYFGAEGAIKNEFPYDISTNISVEIDRNSDIKAEEKAIFDYVDKKVNEYDAQKSDEKKYRKLDFFANLTNDGKILKMTKEGYETEYINSIFINFIPLSDYNTIKESNEILSDGEMLLLVGEGENVFDKATMNGLSLTAKKTLTYSKTDKILTESGGVFFVVNDSDFEKAIFEATGLVGNFMNVFYSMYDSFNVDISDEKQIELENSISSDIWNVLDKDRGLSYSIYGQASAREDFFSIYGGILFLCIMLSVVFLVAAVLIIYYKQLSEGYEDQKRFDIMQKVGMTKDDIKKSVNSQMLAVFLIPIALALLHLAFAFPMVKQMLMLFAADDAMLLLKTAVVSAVSFTILYTIVCKLTSNAYYNIVSDAK